MTKKEFKVSVRKAINAEDTYKKACLQVWVNFCKLFPHTRVHVDLCVDGNSAEDYVLNTAHPYSIRDITEIELCNLAQEMIASGGDEDADGKLEFSGSVFR